MVTDQIEYIPITTEEAAEAVLSGLDEYPTERQGASLYHAQIPDLCALVEEVQSRARGLGLEPAHIELRLMSCRILACKYSRPQVRLQLNLSNIIRRGGGNQMLDSTVFAPTSDFERVAFESPVDFSGVEFVGFACFAGCTFDDVAGFIGTDFRRGATFAESTSRRRAEFFQASFVENANFAYADFREAASFLETTFAGDAFFLGAKFAEEADFERTKIEGLANFGMARVGKSLTLSGADFGSKGRLDLHDVDLRPGARIVLTIEELGKRGVAILRHEDSENKEELASAAVQYTMLRDNFRALPTKTDDEEDLCHYKAMDLRRQASDWRWLHRFVDWCFLKWCWGYGVYLRNIAVTIFLVIVGCGVLYHVGAGPETMKGYCATAFDAPSAGESHPSPPPLVGGIESGESGEECDTEFHPLYFSVITFTTIGYGDYAPRGWLRVVAAVEGFLGLFLMAVFTVSFARKFLR